MTGIVRRAAVMDGIIDAALMDSRKTGTYCQLVAVRDIKDRAFLGVVLLIKIRKGV